MDHFENTCRAVRAASVCLFIYDSTFLSQEIHSAGVEALARHDFSAPFSCLGLLRASPVG